MFARFLRRKCFLVNSWASGETPHEKHKPEKQNYYNQKDNADHQLGEPRRSALGRNRGRLYFDSGKSGGVGFAIVRDVSPHLVNAGRHRRKGHAVCARLFASRNRRIKDRTARRFDLDLCIGKLKRFIGLKFRNKKNPGRRRVRLHRRVLYH